MGFYEGKKVLVTGGAGIAGQNLVKRLLTEGAKVTATEYMNRTVDLVSKGNSNLTIEVGDLRNIEYCQEIVTGQDIVLSCAAFIRGAKGQANANTQLDLIRNNLVAGINTIYAAVKAKVPRFGFVGSSTMYPPLEFVVEDQAFEGDPWPGYAGVGWMKRYLEKVCMFLHKNSSTQFAMARTTALYGPYDVFNPELSHVIPALIMKAADHMNPFEMWGDGTELRQFIYVEDFVDGFLKVVELHPTADPINITNSRVNTVNDVVQYAVDAAGYAPEIKHISGPRMIDTRVVSTEKAKKLLGWEAPTTLEEGIHKTFTWYQEHRNA